METVKSSIYWSDMSQPGIICFKLSLQTRCLTQVAPSALNIKDEVREPDPGLEPDGREIPNKSEVVTICSPKKDVGTPGCWFHTRALSVLLMVLVLALILLFFIFFISTLQVLNLLFFWSEWAVVFKSGFWTQNWHGVLQVHVPENSTAPVWSLWGLAVAPALTLKINVDDQTSFYVFFNFPPPPPNLTCVLILSAPPVGQQRYSDDLRFEGWFFFSYSLLFFCSFLSQINEADTSSQRSKPTPSPHRSLGPS